MKKILDFLFKPFTHHNQMEIDTFDEADWDWDSDSDSDGGKLINSKALDKLWDEDPDVINNKVFKNIDE